MFVLTASVLAVPATSAHAAEPPILWQRDFKPPQIPRGVVADPDSGNVYLAQQSLGRIEQYTIWGEFIRAFGWDVAPEGAPGDTASNQLETCTTSCQVGVGGSGPGQFKLPQGIALDSAGDLYVFDSTNRGLQKFDVSSPEVTFEWMIGAGVNQGPNNPGDRCSAADVAAGDTCGAGASGTGPSQFTDPPGFGFSGVGSFIATDSSDQVYVGGVGRVQRFDSGGTYLGETPVPGEVVNGVVVGPNGELYVTYLETDAFGSRSAPDVRELDVATGAVLTVFPAGRPLGKFGIPDPKGPTALAVDATGHLHVFVELGISNVSPLLEFDSAGNLVNSFGQPKDFFDNSGSGGSTGIATSSACGVDGTHLYVSKFHGSGPFLRAYGPPPDPELCPPPAVPPTISESFAAEVGETSVDLRTRINPHFWPDARFRVEYGLTDCSASSCTSEPLPPGALLTSDVVDADRTGSLQLKGLEPDTTYHYRFVATSGGGGPVFGPDQTFATLSEPPVPNTNCPNQEFRTGPSAPLPDCRAYEMVTPLDKGGADIDSLFGNGFDADGERPGYHYQATPDGDALTYTSFRAFGDPASAPWNSQYLASRDPESGWQSENLNAPRNATILLPSRHQENPFLAFTEDLCSAWLIQDTDLAIGDADNPGFADLYRRRGCEDSGFELISNAAPKSHVPYDFENPDFNPPLYRVGGFSEDGTRTFFTSNAQLTANAPSNPGQFKAYVNNSGSLRLVSVLPDGSTAATHAFVGTPAGFGMTELRAYSDSLDNAVSEDGSQVYWTAEQGTGFGGAVYLRLNPERSQSPVAEGKCTDPTRACTLPVSGTVSPDSARFRKATPDGSKALFTMESGPNAGELYSYDAAAQASTLIAKGGFVAASDDLSRIYFRSTEVLDAGATAGKGNLYFWEEGAGATFIATDTGISRARVTPDGLRLAFQSQVSLTGYDNTDPDSGEPASEVFLYGAEADQLNCVSCPRTGARPQPRILGTNIVKYPADARLPIPMSALYPGTVLSEEGNRLFFSSFSRLLPADVNGKQDVYQWEAAGSGDCEASSAAFDSKAGGCISLISTGQGSEDSSFVDASADGRDVFIRSREQLHPADTDELLDIYDARAGGGLPAPPPPPAPCQGDPCQGDPSAPPANTGAGTAAFEGPPNERQGAGPCTRVSRQVRRVMARARKAPAKSNRAQKLKRKAEALKRRAARCYRKESR